MSETKFPRTHAVGTGTSPNMVSQADTGINYKQDVCIETKGLYFSYLQVKMTSTMDGMLPDVSENLHATTAVTHSTIIASFNPHDNSATQLTANLNQNYFKQHSKTFIRAKQRFYIHPI
jgi:Tfp pilus assembly protein PilW